MVDDKEFNEDLNAFIGEEPRVNNNSYKQPDLLKKKRKYNDLDLDIMKESSTGTLSTTTKENMINTNPKQST